MKIATKRGEYIFADYNYDMRYAPISRSVNVSNDKLYAVYANSVYLQYKYRYGVAVAEKKIVGRRVLLVILNGIKISGISVIKNENQD